MRSTFFRRTILRSGLVARRMACFATLLMPLLATAPTLHAEPVDLSDWTAVEAQARGQTVYWHAWGGEPRINAYIAWVADVMKERHGIDLQHVKVDDTGNVVSRVIAEKAAGEVDDGAVDLVWVNGENFAAMKAQGLLRIEGWAEQLPSWKNVDVAGKPTVVSDFTVATEGLEAPWGMAQLVFMHDTARLEAPPRSIAELARWAEAHPGLFTYPQPPDYIGTTLLKQALYELAPDPAVLATPADDRNFDTTVAPLLAYLDALHPFLWRSGRIFPQNGTQMRQLLGDGEIDIAMTFNPGAASNAIANGELPETVRTYVFSGGTIGNTHFVAIPFNSGSAAAAMVTANFLMSPEAQARKQDPAIWGDPTVLNVAGLPAEGRALFDDLALGVATLSPEELGRILPEPHPSWMTRLEAVWQARYGTE